MAKRRRFYVGTKDRSTEVPFRYYWPILDRNYIHPVSPAWIWGAKRMARVVCAALNAADEKAKP